MWVLLHFVVQGGPEKQVLLVCHIQVIVFVIFRDNTRCHTNIITFQTVVKYFIN